MPHNDSGYYYDAALDTAEGLEITDPDAFEDDWNPDAWVPDQSFCIYNFR